MHIIPKFSASDGIKSYVSSLIDNEVSNYYETYICSFYWDANIDVLKWFENLDVYTSRLSKAMFERVSNRGLKFLLKNFFLVYFLNKGFSLKRIIKEISPDIIFVHGEDAELIAPIFLKRNKIINIIHSEKAFPINPIYKFILVKYSRTKYFKTIFTSESLLKDIHEKKGNFTVIKAGIDLTELNQLEYVKNVKRIGFVGRFSHEKNIINITKSFKQVIKIKPGLNCFIIGEGHLKNKISNLISTEKEKIFLINEIIDKIEVYKKFDLLVIASDYEALPLVLLEAMAAGRIVLATNVGIVPQIIKNNINGFLLENPSVDEITYKILSIVNFYNISTISNKAKSSVKQFSSIRTRKQFYKFLEEMLDERTEN